MSASLSTGQATSSMSMDVPASRAAPTMGISPLRTSQKTLHVCVSRGQARGRVRKGTFTSRLPSTHKAQPRTKLRTLASWLKG